MNDINEPGAVPAEQHMRTIKPEDGKFRAHCTCGWKGRKSWSRDEAGGQHAGHTARVWAKSEEGRALIAKAGVQK